MSCILKRPSNLHHPCYRLELSRGDTGYVVHVLSPNGLVAVVQTDHDIWVCRNPTTGYVVGTGVTVNAAITDAGL